MHRGMKLLVSVFIIKVRSELHSVLVLFKEFKRLQDPIMVNFVFHSMARRFLHERSLLLSGSTAWRKKPPA